MKRQRRFGLSAVIGVLAASCGSFDPANESPDGGTSGEGGVAPAAEDCLDGRDDNDDGKRDCEEPTCAAYVRCVPVPGALESGWNGYFALVENGDCPKEAKAGSDVWSASADGATCGACKCDATISCTGTVNLEESLFAGCNPVKPFTLPVGECGAIPAAAGGDAQYWRISSFGVPTCAPSSDPPTLPAKFHRARLCSGVRLGAGCPSGQVCASSAGGGVNIGTCISRPHPGGAPIACPPAFPVAHLVAPGSADPESAFVESRGCTACSCVGPTGASCNAKLTLHGDGSCTSEKGSVTGAQCTNVSCSSKGCLSGRVDVAPVNGTCAAQPGKPSGSVDLAGAGQQLCCDR